MNVITAEKNPLGQESIPVLLRRFAIPSIVAMLVSAAYNIVDQLFIGQSVGELGNAATNIAFPLANACTAISLLLGIGASAAFNLAMGRKEYDTAPKYIGNAITFLLLGGLGLSILTECLLDPMMVFFGASKAVLPYASEYVRITALGFPFLVLSVGGAHLIRADGRPHLSMICNIVGAVINTALDAWFVFGLGWGITGAAWATVIGQVAAAVLAGFFLTRFQTVKLRPKDFLPNFSISLTNAKLGMASFFNQLAMMVLQITLNNSLRHYGGLSIYGEDIPVACAGIVIKVAQFFFGVVIGLAQAMQPIASYNYGAQKYDRVRQVYKLTSLCALVISIVAEAIFLLAPELIISMFSKGTEPPTYYQFAAMYFRIYLFFTFVNFIQPITSTFFTAIGKPIKGAFMSLTRQILFLLPLVLFLPLFFGIDGVVFSAPIADSLAVTCAVVMMVFEWRDMKRKEAALQAAK